MLLRPSVINANYNDFKARNNTDIRILWNMTFKFDI